MTDKRRRIDNDKASAINTRRLLPAYPGSFVITLKCLQQHTAICGELNQLFVNFTQRNGTKNLRPLRAQEIQARPVQYQYAL